MRTKVITGDRDEDNRIFGAKLTLIGCLDSPIDLSILYLGIQLKKQSPQTFFSFFSHRVDYI